MARAGYRIADEPVPGGLAHIAVRPIWPLFAMMFVGPWFAWPWFVLNGFAVGSPTRLRELIGAIVGFAGSFGIVYAISHLVEGEVLTQTMLPYAGIVLIAWKISVSYWLYMLQERTFEIYEYFGGIVRNGLFILILVHFMGGRLVWNLFQAQPLLWKAVN